MSRNCPAETCDLTVAAKDGQLQPCNAICKNVGILSNHKKKHPHRTKNLLHYSSR
ncbi:hypothetical protein [Endozoicomonas sp. 8E]|uniref:hypothetical protein n=1 Tax=Endozoicomonas sp. 8E TaxID=3035692 RepID=UPI0029390C5C|nr:hypothetical protein [Endozoicomonas sp. 8E]WOG27104.1 hypothetical protein P6910_21515 [Endozoicomonas sp. 8E]